MTTESVEERYLMNPRISLPALVLATLWSAGALAQDRAVEATQFTLDVLSVESDTADSTSSGTLGAGLGTTFGIGRYFGASLNINYLDTSVRTRDVVGDASGGSRPSCSFENLGGSASVFFRRPTLGKVGFTYGSADLKASCDGDAIFPLTREDKLGTDTYRGDAEYYLGDFTFGAAYTTTSLEDGDDLKTTTLNVSWYPLDSLKLSLWGNDLYDDNTYGLMVEHQPQMFGDGASVRLGVSTSNQSPKTTTIELGLSYFFGRNVPLKTRDRQYR
jgi:hypothetical protein